MNHHELREDGLAKQEALMREKAAWRRARTLPTTTGQLPVTIKHLQMIWAAWVNLLIGR